MTELKDKLPNADEVLLERFRGEGDSCSHRDCDLIVEAMHEYARLVLDVAAESAKAEIEISEYAGQKDLAVLNKDSILRLKELLK